MTVASLAHPGCLRQSLESRKIVVLEASESQLIGSNSRLLVVDNERMRPDRLVFGVCVSFSALMLLIRWQPDRKDLNP